MCLAQYFSPVEKRAAARSSIFPGKSTKANADSNGAINATADAPSKNNNIVIKLASTNARAARYLLILIKRTAARAHKVKRANGAVLPEAIAAPTPNTAAEGTPLFPSTAVSTSTQKGITSLVKGVPRILMSSVPATMVANAAARQTSSSVVGIAFALRKRALSITPKTYPESTESPTPKSLTASCPASVKSNNM